MNNFLNKSKEILKLRRDIETKILRPKSITIKRIFLASGLELFTEVRSIILMLFNAQDLWTYRKLTVNNFCSIFNFHHLNNMKMHNTNLQIRFKIKIHIKNVVSTLAYKRMFFACMYIALMRMHEKKLALIRKRLR